MGALSGRGTRPRIRPVPSRQPLGGAARCLLVLSPFGAPALACWVILRPLGLCAFLTVGLPSQARTPSGLPRCPRARSDRDGCPLYSGGAVPTRPAQALRPPLAASQRPTPVPRCCLHPPRAWDNGASSRVHSRSPVRSSPLPVTPGGSGSLGVCSGLHTPPLPATHAEVGTGTRALARNHVTGINRPSPTHPLATRTLVSHACRPIIPDPSRGLTQLRPRRPAPRTPNPRTCSPTSPPSPTREPRRAAATRWSPSWAWPPPRCWPAPGRWPRSPSGPPTRPSRSGPRSAPAAIRSRPLGRPGRGHHPPHAGPPGPRRAGRARSAPGWPTATVPDAAASRRRAVAVDGKTLRGARAPTATAARCTCWPRWTTPPARCWPNARSAARPARSPAFPPLLADLDLAGVVVTADALQTHRRGRRVPGHQQAGPLPVHRQGQPAHPAGPLRPACPGTASPCWTAPATAATAASSCAPSRRSRSASFGFPHAAQVLQVTRKTRDLHTRRWRTVTVYAITSLPFDQASPARLADLLRGHWAIESAAPRPRRHLRRGRLPGPHRRRPAASWPACATWPSACSAGQGRSTSPPRSATTPATPPGPSPPSGSAWMNRTSRENDGALGSGVMGLRSWEYAAPRARIGA